MKLLVTGAAGFLGRELTRALLAQSQFKGQAIESLMLTDQVRCRIRSRLTINECMSIKVTC